MTESNGVFAEAHKLEENGEAFALAFIIESRGSVPRESGRMLIRLDGSTLGTVGGGPIEAQVIEEALEALKDGESRTVRRKLVPEGESAAGMECGGAVAVRVDVSAAPPRLLLVGGGHVNLAVAAAASVLGFAVEIAETRPNFCSPERFPMARALHLHEDLIEAVKNAGADGNTSVVIATHDDDIRALSAVIEYPVVYLGMLGSKRKAAKAVSVLRERGVDESLIARLRTPVGLDIGAETPAEIAISVLAEIIRVRSGRTGLPLQGMSKDLVVIRGGGDLASGTAWRLARSGFRVMILEIENPTVIRKSVAFATALENGTAVVEGITSRKAANLAEAYAILEEGFIPVLADPRGKTLPVLNPAVVVDGILAKKNLGTRRDMAPVVVALGPGFRAGKEGDCHAVVETARGHELGRVILEGEAAPNTGTPGVIAGRAAERVLRAPTRGIFEPLAELGDLVKEDQILARVSGRDILCPFDGKLRGILTAGIEVEKGFKVGDVDPRGAEVDEKLISDKARAVAGGVLEAILHLRSLSGDIADTFTRGENSK